MPKFRGVDYHVPSRNTHLFNADNPISATMESPGIFCNEIEQKGITFINNKSVIRTADRGRFWHLKRIREKGIFHAQKSLMGNPGRLMPVTCI